MNRTDAEENLRVIRSLMEKATIYRAISVPTALVGGLVSVLVGMALRWYGSQDWEGPDAHKEIVYLLAWLAVLAVTGAANAWFIWRDAQRRQEPFISPQMKKALWALFPPLLCAAFGTMVISTSRDMNREDYLPSMWMMCYGLALLATAHFAPSSIPRLGWVFLFAGIASSWLLHDRILLSSLDVLNALMMLTFGCFHLIYAFCVWRRNKATAIAEN
jgi:hypothetical protein